MKEEKQNISVRVFEDIFNYLFERSKEEKRSLSSLCGELLNKQIELEKAQENKDVS